jgi:hypothetical protein
MSGTPIFHINIGKRKCSLYAGKYGNTNIFIMRKVDTAVVDMFTLSCTRNIL